MSCQGYRGYISTRMMERSVPHSVQQTVIREYCRKHGLEFLLSATEYCMDGSTMMLESALREESSGIVFYSMYQLPVDSYKRTSMLYRALRSRKQIHFAAEGIKIISRDGIAKLEDIFLLRSIIHDN